MFNKKTDRWERCDRTIKDIDHIGIVVRDLEKAIKLLENLDLRVSRREDIEHLKVRVAFFEVSGNRIELISPSSEDHELTHHIENHGGGSPSYCLSGGRYQPNNQKIRKYGYRACPRQATGRRA